MAIKVGINGFGRIGRVALRILEERGCDNYEICGINLRNADLDYMVYQAKYDTIFRTFRGVITRDEQHLIVNGRKIRVFSEDNPANIRWDACGAEYIIESTGAFNNTEGASGHFEHGAKKAVLSAPAKGEMPTFVMGVNHMEYTPDMKVVSNASCTTNCLAPMVKVVNDAFGVEQGLMTTVHAATAKQKAVDSRAGRDWRTGRSVLGNIIPSSTGAAKAVGLVLPELKGRLTGMSFRVPTNDVSVVDLTVQLKTNTKYNDICDAMREAARTSMRGIITCTRDQIVSTDLTGFFETCIFDETAGVMISENFVKLIAWYDNEWGYTNKLIDLLTHMYRVDQAQAE